jgi:hypothetical protein
MGALSLDNRAPGTGILNGILFNIVVASLVRATVISVVKIVCVPPVTKILIVIKFGLSIDNAAAPGSGNVVMAGNDKELNIKVLLPGITLAGNAL